VPISAWPNSAARAAAEIYCAQRTEVFMSDLNDLTKNISQEQIDKLINMASKKLGMTPSQLRSIASTPQDANELLSRLTKEKSELAKSALNDPKVLERLLDSNPQAKKLIEEILGDKKNG
jgi:chromosome segregation and condensation protein ScpB